VNDAVLLAIQNLIKIRAKAKGPKVKQGQKPRQNRVLYLDVDIHHADGVQRAFYDTDQVMTVSFHRFASGFFPSQTGSIQEKGMHGTRGVGYNLNIPLPRGLQDAEFLVMVDLVMDKVLMEYDPDIVVLCVGADGLRGDALVQETNEGWDLSPEGLAECVRRVASICGVVVAIQKWGWVLIPVSIQVRAMTPHFEGES